MFRVGLLSTLPRTTLGITSSTSQGGVEKKTGEVTLRLGTNVFYAASGTEVIE